MTLKHRILTGYGVALLLLGLVIAWSVVNLVDLGRASEAILRENYRSIVAAQHMADALDLQAQAGLLQQLGQDEAARAAAAKSQAAFLQWLARAKDNVTIPGEAEVLRSIEADYTAYLGQVSQADVAASTGGIDQTARLDTLRQACSRLLRLNEGTMYAASDDATRLSRRATWSTSLAAVAGLCTALVFSLVLAGRLVRPLHDMVAAARRLGAGDYAVKVPVEAGDEIGMLAREFNLLGVQLDRYHQMHIGAVSSERQKGEAILASIDDGVLVLDADLRVTGANPAAQRVLQFRGGDLGRPLAELLPDSALLPALQAAVRSGTPPTLDEQQRLLRVTGTDGPRDFQVGATRIPTDDGQAAGLVLLLRDVTRLKEVDRLKSEFVLAASHELRTPLTSIGMSIHLLLENATPRLQPRECELLYTARDEVSRLKALVTDLLELSRLEGGRIEMAFEQVRVAELVTHVQEIFSGQLQQARVELDADLEAGLPDVIGDASKLTWVLTNLVSNALRYTRTGGRIQLRAQQAAGYVHVSVCDAGPGIAAEHQSAIFDKFVRIGGEGTSGSGLGLAICREIVRAHGGSIWVESALGQGSTFTFATPVAA